MRHGGAAGGDVTARGLVVCACGRVARAARARPNYDCAHAARAHYHYAHPAALPTPP